jgi:hydrogenase maturation protease
MASQERILVLGIGNPLMRDEGVGVRIVELLMSRYEWPERVEFVDAGTMGLGMLHLFRDIDYALVVDAIQGTGHEPGTMVLLNPEEIAPNQIMHSLHDVRLSNVLEAAELAGMSPKVECLGVQIEQMEAWVLELSPALSAMLEDGVQAVLDLLAEHGVTPVPRVSENMDATVIENLRKEV